MLVRCVVLHTGFTHMRLTQYRLFARLDKIRFRLSCTLYKNPLLLSGVLLMAGGAIGAAFNHGVATQAETAHAQAQETELRALSIALGELQARADRLDSFGQQWVDEAGLEEAGFDFGDDPGRGGGTDVAGSAFERPNPRMIGEDLQLVKQRFELIESQLKILDQWKATADEIPEGIPHAYPGGRHQTSAFGVRHDPFGRGRGFHSGIDLSARVGDPVMAMASGRVVFSGWQSGYGKTIEIDHGRGYHTRYAHNSKLVVKVGQQIEIGQVIAKAGSTGRSTGAHLHIEVLVNGKQVDPRPFLDRGRRVAAEQRKLLSKLATLEKPTVTWRGLS